MFVQKVIIKVLIDIIGCVSVVKGDVEQWAEEERFFAHRKG